jgi:hypothetical protein
MIFEGAHWTAPRSLKLFGQIVARIATLPVTVDRDVPAGVCSAVDRPTARDFPHDQGAMIDRLVGNKPLGADLRQDIIERTDGIPLFVEEMTKAMLEFQPRPAPNQRKTLTWHSPALVGDQAALRNAGLE